MTYVKVAFPEDKPLYDKLRDLARTHFESFEGQNIYLTDAANSVIEGDYPKVEKYLNDLLRYQYTVTLELLSAIYMFKCDVGAWE